MLTAPDRDAELVPVVAAFRGGGVSATVVDAPSVSLQERAPEAQNGVRIAMLLGALLLQLLVVALRIGVYVFFFRNA